MPFPLAMTVLSAREETRGLAAWGWAVNGAVSVVGVVLAQTLAMEHGFGLVLGLVAVLYAIAYLVFPRPSDPDPSNPVPPRRGPGSSRTASAVERGGA
jgi:CHASE2 domain-containing sensor protein